MRLKYQFETMELDDHIVAIPVGAEAGEFHGVVKMNDTSAFIFNCLKEETTEDAIVDAMEKAYDAPKSAIVEDVKRCIEEFKEKGLLV